jgi:hypothetical protein
VVGRRTERWTTRSGSPASVTHVALEYVGTGGSKALSEARRAPQGASLRFFWAPGDVEAGRLEEAFDAHLHPRDRLGEWTRSPGRAFKTAAENRGHLPPTPFGPKDEREAAERLAAVRKITEPARVATRITGPDLLSVLRQGRFKSQHETRSSHGLYDPEDRARVERGFFGAPESPTDHPVYGYLYNGDEPASTNGPSSGFGGTLAQYGPYRVVFRPEVRKRTTYTAGDSLAVEWSGDAQPLPLDDPGLDADVDRGNDASSGPWEVGYYEAQVHGELTPADISRVEFDPYMDPEELAGEPDPKRPGDAPELIAPDAPDPALLAALRGRGIPFEDWRPRREAELRAWEKEYGREASPGRAKPETTYGELVERSKLAKPTDAEELALGLYDSYGYAGLMGELESDELEQWGLDEATDRSGDLEALVRRAPRLERPMTVWRQGEPGWPVVAFTAIEGGVGDDLTDAPDAKRYVLPAGTRAYASADSPESEVLVPLEDVPGDVAGRVVDAARRGGATVHPKTANEPKEGFAVALQGHSSITPADEFFAGPTGDEKGRRVLREWLRRERAAFGADTHVGVWLDRKHGEVVLDPVDVFPPDQRDEAIAAGRGRDQQAIYDLGAGAEIPTGGTGGREASGRASRKREQAEAAAEWARLRPGDRFEVKSDGSSGPVSLTGYEVVGNESDQYGPSLRVRDESGQETVFTPDVGSRPRKAGPPDGRPFAEGEVVVRPNGRRASVLSVDGDRVTVLYRSGRSSRQQTFRASQLERAEPRGT